MNSHLSCVENADAVRPAALWFPDGGFCPFGSAHDPVGQRRDRVSDSLLRFADMDETSDWAMTQKVAP